MQSLRDNPDCAKQEYDSILKTDYPGMTFAPTYNPDEDVTASLSSSSPAPRVAVLREQGINGHVEMAAAFALAGFDAVDVHMSDLHDGRVDLADFTGMVACGGFSYGDVLGAGSGWAKSILYNDRLKAMFGAFFKRPDTFSLGVCNGCQMISQLKELIPGAEHWPDFVRNLSEQFEARYVCVEILESPSLFLKGMSGSRIPIAVAHGEGRVEYGCSSDAAKVADAGLLALRYVDGTGASTEQYPLNPNGSIGGETGFTTSDGRVTIMMPHPERGFRSTQLSYKPDDLFCDEAGPWMRMFRNARVFVG